jgi:acyl-CoA synthetase (AMP-forming)/AMP-acid ligase II/acyl carrier protein
MPVAPSTIPELVRRVATATPDATAITAPGRRALSYREMQAHVARTAATLHALGVGRGDRVAVVLPNGPEMATAFLAVASAATCAPLNPAYGETELDFYFEDLGVRALIVARGARSPAGDVARARSIPVLELAVPNDLKAGIFSLGEQDGLTGAPADAGPDDVALVLHTSGTTSRPKMVPLRHRNLCASAVSVRQTLALGPADSCLNVMPLFHIHGLVCALLASLSAGASVSCTPGFFAPQFLDWLAESDATWYTAVPTMHQAVLARAAAHSTSIARSRLRFIRSSSAALPPRVQSDLERVFGVPVIESYGMTEASHQMASNPLPPRERKPGSVGIASGPDVAVMDDAGTLLPYGQTGEVVVRGPGITSGYENNPEANRAAFSDGWFRTGDQGHLDAEGYLYLTGRRKEIINRGGEKIAPREIDEVLLDHPAVAEAVAFAVPHEMLGEEVGAAVVRRDQVTVTEQELRAFAAARLAHFKVPTRMLFVPAIPKGPTGKVQRVGLAERLGVTASPIAERAAYVAPSSPIETRVCVIWEEVLGMERVGLDDDFFLLGGDSMLATRVIARVRDVFAIELPLLALFESPTPRGMANAIVHDVGSHTAAAD